MTSPELFWLYKVWAKLLHKLFAMENIFVWSEKLGNSQKFNKQSRMVIQCLAKKLVVWPFMKHKVPSN